ncbi:MAG: hypothetical protein HYU77_05235 [Betaproteobacteria bacterium]|nr:hypothetical protein [Betaproteobacteria bacterium]
MNGMNMERGQEILLWKQYYWQAISRGTEPGEAAQYASLQLHQVRRATETRHPGRQPQAAA